MSTPSVKRFPTRLVVSGLVIAALVVGFAYALPKLRLAEVAATLEQARALPMLGAGFAALSMQIMRAAFWRLALQAPRTVPLRRLARYTILGSAGSVLLPARAGEAVRVWLLAELEGVPAVAGIGAMLAERALDVASMVLVLAPLPWLLPDAPTWVTRALWLLSAAGVAVVIAVTLLARRGARRAPDGGLLARLGHALAPLSSPMRLIGGIAVLACAWLADLAALVLTARALGITLPPAAPFLVLLSVNLAIAVPAAPAQLGSHEAGTLLALSLLHVPAPQALAFALLYHAAHVLPLLLAATLDAPLLLRALRDGTRSTPSTA